MFLLFELTLNMDIYLVMASIGVNMHFGLGKWHHESIYTNTLGAD